MGKKSHKLGPLASLIGTWEGKNGLDQVATYKQYETKKRYKEKITFELAGPIKNQGVDMQGIKYTVQAYEKGRKKPIHSEEGYFLWDAKNKQIMRCFMMAGGVSILAGGIADEDCKQIDLLAEAGCDTFGICSNQFLGNSEKAVRFTMHLEFTSKKEIRYEQVTYLKQENKPRLKEVVDSNLLKKVA